MPGPCSPIRNEEWLTLSLALRKEGLTLVRPHPGLESLGGGQAPAAKVNNHGSRVAGPLLPPRLFLSPVTLVAFSLMLSSSTWFFSIPGICRTGRVLSLSDLRLWMVRGGTRTAAPRWAAGQEALHRVRDPHPVASPSYCGARLGVHCPDLSTRLCFSASGCTAGAQQ